MDSKNLNMKGVNNMKKILIILLTFALTYNSNFCHASDDSEYEVSCREEKIFYHK